MNAADARVTAAREFLRNRTARPLNGQPSARVAREGYELRKLLAQLLDYITETGPGEAQREALAGMLADAVAYREPSGLCEDCEAHPAGLCEDHAADLDRCDEYRAALRPLGIEVTA